MSKNKIEFEKFIPSASDERYKFVIENHKKLLRLLHSVTAQQHEQGVWARNAPENPCGTAACALGWAVISGEFDGLRYCMTPDSRHYIPVVNNRYVTIGNEAPTTPFFDGGDFMRVGYWYFGGNTTNDVFGDLDLSLSSVIKQIEQRLQDLISYNDVPSRYRDRL